MIVRGLRGCGWGRCSRGGRSERAWADLFIFERMGGKLAWVGGLYHHLRDRVLVECFHYKRQVKEAWDFGMVDRGD